MKLTADQYFLYYLRASDVQSLSYSSVFVIIRQSSKVQAKILRAGSPDPHVFMSMT